MNKIEFIKNNLGLVSEDIQNVVIIHLNKEFLSNQHISVEYNSDLANQWCRLNYIDKFRLDLSRLDRDSLLAEATDKIIERYGSMDVYEYLKKYKRFIDLSCNPIFDGKSILTFSVWFSDVRTPIGVSSSYQRERHWAGKGILSMVEFVDGNIDAFSEFAFADNSELFQESKIKYNKYTLKITKQGVGTLSNVDENTAMKVIDLYKTLQYGPSNEN